MKRKILLLTILVALFSMPKIVKAKECYYENNNGVCFDKVEYQFLSKMYWEGSQDLFTKEDYQKFINSDLLKGELVTVISPSVVPLSSSVSDNDKTVKISKVCTTECYISITATWSKVPPTRSYDVIGARLEGTSLLNTPITTVTSSTQKSTSNNIKKFNNGFGVSVSLPGTGVDIIVNQTFKTTKGGTVYASYQHAKSIISLANSQNFTISALGYGKVFKFSGTAANIYDRMYGVSITL